MKSKEIVFEMDVPFLPVRQLKVGNLQLMYEEGRLRYLKYNDREVLRMIYLALRDENWETIEGKIQNENIHIHKDNFEITYEILYIEASIRYKATIEIIGFEDVIS